MNLLKAAATVSGFTLLSRMTGLIRETLIASLFGASAATDAFFVAFRLPNMLRRLFAEGAFSQAFVPLLAATRATEGDAATQRLIDAVNRDGRFFVSHCRFHGRLVLRVSIGALATTRAHVAAFADTLLLEASRA